MKVNCPTCQSEMEWKAENRSRPFCSKHCQLIDLGEWADEEHNISTPISAISGMSLDPEKSTLSSAWRHRPFPFTHIVHTASHTTYARSRPEEFLHCVNLIS